MCVCVRICITHTLAEKNAQKEGLWVTFNFFVKTFFSELLHFFFTISICFLHLFEKVIWNMSMSSSMLTIKYFYILISLAILFQIFVYFSLSSFSVTCWTDRIFP